MLASEVATEHGDLEQIGGNGPVLDARRGACCIDAAERRDFSRGKNCLRFRLGPFPCRHGKENIHQLTAIRASSNPVVVQIIQPE